MKSVLLSGQETYVLLLSEKELDKRMEGAEKKINCEKRLEVEKKERKPDKRKK